jgi:sigma-B regulation protein RsbU (phosphoserine phosphatase)
MKPRERKTIRIPARLENLEKLIDFILSCLKSAGIDKETASEIHLAVDEACTNSIKYAYPNGPAGDIELSCVLNRRSATTTIRDWGAPFNPLESPPPDLNLDIDERPIGGLGIYLMKKFSDRLEYRRENGSNLLTIIKKLD